MDGEKGCHMVFKAIAGRNLMEYSFHDDEIIGYQLEMLANNQISGLLKSEVLRVDGEIRLSYDITSLITLKKLFERRDIGRNDLLVMLKQIASVLDGLEEYLLDSGGIVFDSRYIFINPQNLHMEFTYIPLIEMPKDLEALKNLLLQMIIHDIRFINEPSDNYVQKLIEMLKAQVLDISSIKNYIQTMEAKAVPIQPRAVNEIPVPKRMVPAAINDKIEKKLSPVIPPTMEKEIKKQQPEAKTIKYPRRSFIILSSVIGAFILFGVVLSFTETFSFNNPDFLLSLFGYIMIGGALTYLVYSKLFTPDKKIEKKTENKSEPGQTPAKSMEYVNKAFTIPTSQVMQAKTEATQAAQMSDRTVILDVKSLDQPSLKGVNGNKPETIIISCFPFMIGRLEGQVDYCLKNPAVGKMHAEIKKTDEGFLISDMNSRNGTVLNGERLEPSREYKIENGSRVAFANDEFIFYAGRA